MDLKSSLIDTNIKIYPSEKLRKFLQTLPNNGDAPENIKLFTTSKDGDKKDKVIEEVKPIQIYLNNDDLQNLDKIKKAVDKLKDEKPETEQTTDDVTEALGKIVNEQGVDEKEVTKESLELEKDNEESTEKREGPFLFTSDIDWLYCYLLTKRKKEKCTPFLHDLLDGIHIQLPENGVIKRNPVLEARCVKLRAQQEARDYRKMTKGVDNVRMRFPDDSIAFQMKQLNRQLIAIGQFIISIFAGFLFGFRGVEWMVGNLDFGFRLLLGVMCALVIALAEIYFLAKKLNEELSVPETVQLGGPPKFVDEKTYDYDQRRVKTNKNKDHQD